MRELKTGYAYHGNRMPQHVEADLRDMVSHNANLIVHMFSHTDWDRHMEVMKDIVAMSEGYGMETWIDNWGLGGPPGDKSHFLAYYPEAHVMYSDGTMDPVRACLNSPDFRRFTREWIDAVGYIGGKTIFWAPFWADCWQCCLPCPAAGSACCGRWGWLWRCSRRRAA